jgi:hypothetical protein
MVEEPAVGDLLPLVDGGFHLQYSPLMLYSEGDFLSDLLWLLDGLKAAG